MSPGAAPTMMKRGANLEHVCGKGGPQVGRERGRCFLDASLELAKESDWDTHRRPKLFPRSARENV